MTTSDITFLGTHLGKSPIKISTLLLYLAAIVLVSMFVVAAFNPGCPDVDTLDMWAQAHVHHYQDWHPIALTLIMAAFIKVHDGFQPVIVLQIVLFSCGFILVLRRYLSPVPVVVLLLLICAIPMVFYCLAFVSVDAFMACALIFAIGALSCYSESGNKAFLGLALAGLYLGYATRHNGIFAVVPLLIWPLLRFRWRRALTLFFVILFGFVGINHLTSMIVRARHDYPQQVGLLYDLAALSVARNQILIPPEFQKPGITVAAIEKDLWPYDSVPLFFGANSVLHFTYNFSDMKDLYSTWLRTVPRYPWPYLQFRWNTFTKYAGLGPTETEPFIQACIYPNDIGFQTIENPLFDWMAAQLQRLGQTLLFRPYVYLLIAGLVVLQGIWQKRWDTALIASSVLTYSFSYFPFGQSTHFRLAIYSVLATIILVLRLVAEPVGARLTGYFTGAGARTVVVHLLLIVAMVVAMVPVARLVWPPDVVHAHKTAFANPGFETGNLAPWSTYRQVHAEISSARAHSGKYSLAESEGAGSVWQVISGLVPGRRYKAVAWASASTNATAQAQLAVYDPVADKSVFSNPLTLATPVTFGIWHTFSQDVTANATGTLVIHLFRLPGTGIVYWDDVRVLKQEYK